MSDAAQVLVNSLITGSIYLLAGTGLTLTYGLSRFPNFAFAEFLTFGAYIGYLTMQHPTGHLAVALVTAALATGLLSLAAYFTSLFRAGDPRLQAWGGRRGKLPCAENQNVL